MYATKEECRSVLLRYKKYLKLSIFAKEYGISVSNLSMFLKEDVFQHYMSLMLLNGFILFIQSKLDDDIL